ncbi:uncharacterized protein APUU_20625S [Aspergillus puulaauensis]|uniref:Uncharacterized protein n=1 Tax=Aspergillus puulaauensis TaxID=1220207 RepID=A0A7R7XFU4_9EURO|nr:uncharacterized protein APUU_20625S [Aspergillus puulaauensis]BCS20193.1 hypothetical protein APUU_20625S [Aspergillus puulaauensis]
MEFNKPPPSKILFRRVNNSDIPELASGDPALIKLVLKRAPTGPRRSHGDHSSASTTMVSTDSFHQSQASAAYLPKKPRSRFSQNESLPEEQHGQHGKFPI